MASNDKNEQLKEKIKWTPNEIIEARKALLNLYTAQQNSQGTRLIGFIAGLFVLLQLTQTSKLYGLAQVFSNFPTIIVFGNVPLLWDFLKVVFLFLATTIILYFILRTIFRFAIYGYMSSDIMVVTEDNAKDAIIANTKPNTDPIYKNREVWAFNRATSQILYHHKVYGLFQAHFFFKTGDSKLPDHHDQGVCILVGLSLFLAFLLLLFLW